MAAPKAAAPKAAVEVAPEIAAVIGDPGRPHANFPPVKGLGHIPGKSGLFAGLANVSGFMKRGGEHLREQADTYGKVYRSSFGPIPTVCVADPELLTQILRNEDRVWSAALGWRVFFEGLDRTRPFMDSPALLDFEPQKDIRRLLQPGFSGAAMAGYVQTTAQIVEPAVDSWLAAGRVTFKPAARRLFATIADQVFLGISDPQEAADLDRAMEDVWRAPLAMVRNNLSSTWRRAKRSWVQLRDKLRSQVAERRAGTGTDLFSQVCRVAPEAAWIDDDALVSSYLGLMSAAFDTTSAAVTSMGYALATNPEWQDKLAAEALAAPAQVTAEDLKKLELCDRAWRETLRLYTVASNVPRRPLRDVELGGHRIPAGALVVAMIAPLHLDATVWTNPLAFDPDRFSPERAEDKKQRGAYMPFGAGAHACIGAQLSAMEAKTFWHGLLRKAKVRLAKPYVATHGFSPMGQVSGDVELIVEPR